MMLAGHLDHRTSHLQDPRPEIEIIRLQPDRLAEMERVVIQVPIRQAMPNIAPSTTLACRIVFADRPPSCSAVM